MVKYPDWINGGDFEVACEKFGRGNVRRFDMEMKYKGAWIHTNVKDRIKFLEELRKEGIDFILRTATTYGHARIYVHKKDLERVKEIFLSLFA